MKSIWSKIKGFFSKHVSAIFVLLLVISATLWFITKLSYTYTTEIPVEVSIEGSDFKVACVVEGGGYRLFAYKVFKKPRIELNFQQVQLTPSIFNPGNFVVNSYSLHNSISVNFKDLRIISIGNIPEITISSVN